MDETTRIKILKVLSETNIILSQWNTYEVYFMKRVKPAIAKQMADLEEKLPRLYYEGLRLLGTINKATETRGQRLGTTFLQKHITWDQIFDQFKVLHGECNKLKDMADSILKAQEETKKVLDWIKKPDDPELSQRAVWQQTGLDGESPDAGKWFLETKEFGNWLSGISSDRKTDRVVWLRGISKTILPCQYYLAHSLE